MRTKKLLTGVLTTFAFVSLSFADVGDNLQSRNHHGIGQENSQAQTQISQEIRDLVNQIRNAPPEERYKLMNQFKEKIRELNQNERHKVVEQLREEMQEGIHEKHMEMEQKHMGEGREHGMEKRQWMFNRNEDFQERHQKNSEHSQEMEHGMGQNGRMDNQNFNDRNMNGNYGDRNQNRNHGR